MTEETESSRKLLENLSFCVLDLETTGGNHESDKIIEIGMVRVTNLKISDELNFLIDPEMYIPDFIQKLTSIKQKDVKGQAKIEDKIEEILHFIGDDIIVAHNTSFDVPFLNSVLKRLDREELTNKVLCTNVMTKHMIPEIMNSNLNYMSQLFEIKHSNAHRAHDDALATARLMLKFLDIFISKGIKKVNQLYYPKNKFELDRIHYSKETSKNEIIAKILANDCPMLIILKGDRGIIQGALPINNPTEEISFIEEFINMVDWEMLTIRLLNPVLEGIFQFNNHYLKYPESVREKVLDYLSKRYKTNAEITREYSVEGLDFVITHHLIKDQFVVHSFLNLNTNTKAIFKFPAQKKKMLQFIKSQLKRFEGVQKGKRRHLLHKDIAPLVESFLTKNRTSNNYLFLNRKSIKDGDTHFFKVLEDFSKEDKSTYNFPTNSL
jgi:DNA polymerase-3 subunit alpha (Gram-positive type)